VIYHEELFPGQESNFGLGDMNPTFFFSPKAPFHGWIWGAGAGCDSRDPGPTVFVLRRL
jgi:hypothetical protein